MKASVDSLLQPISEDNPCGPNLEYDSAVTGLERMLEGKPETQFSAAEEPDWKATTEACIELLGRWKELRVAVALTQGLLKMEGLPGFRDGLLVIKGLIARYWDTVHPRLKADDAEPNEPEDPTGRVNILSSLIHPLHMLAWLRRAPLTDSPQMGRLSMADVERSLTGAAAEGAAPISPAQVQGAFRSTPPEKLQTIYQAITESQSAVKEMDKLLTEAVGTNRAVAFDPLVSLLKELQKILAPYAAPDERVETETGGENTASGGEARADGPAISGSIRSRQDVIRVLEQVCDFYKRTEPSSPVPLILQRARRLVDMDFMQLLTDLAPESLNQINVIAGIRGDAPVGEMSP